MIDFASEREAMIERTIRRRGLDDPALLNAFRAVPREEFISIDYAEFAYADGPLPIESGQTISQPYIVALTIDAAGIGPEDKVLEIGAGSGYAAAVIGQIAREVIAIERHHELVELARERMRRLGRGMFAEGRSRDESRFRASRSAREFQLAAQGAAVELLSFPFRLFDLLVESGRQSERPTGRPSDFDDDLD